MREIFKDIKCYEGIYQVSNLGRVRSLKFRKQKVLKPFEEIRGYLKVKLYKNNEVQECKIHRLVAQAFLGENDLTVNHKDGNKKNNTVDNLEYLSNRENIRYSKAKKVIGTNILTGEQMVFDAVQDTKEKGFSPAHISKCCLGKRKKHKGYIWQYKEER